MERLSGLDASFLYLETPEQLLHVSALLILDPSTMPGGYSFESMRDQLAERLGKAPEFRRKLKSVPLRLDHPVWVTDEHFDIDRHVHRMALPAPGGPAELRDLASHLASMPLDRARPLWQMVVIEGYEGGRIAVFAKLHHATVDGVSGASLLSHLCSLAPDDAPIATVSEEDANKVLRKPSDLELLGRAVLSNVSKPLRAVQLLAPTGQAVSRTVARAREGKAMAAPFSAPRTPFNSTITGQRAVAYATMDLADAKAIKNATGTTVNDVVLTVAGGALRAYLSEHNALPISTLTATVPVSVRDLTTRTAGANKISALFAKLGTDIVDPLERLQTVAEQNRNAKEHHQAISADTLQDWAEFAPPRTFGLAMRTYANFRLADRHPVVHNLVISNVPGPPFPLYFNGARMEAMFPLGPVFHGAGLNITVMSNDGTLNVGIIACRESVPDVDRLAELFVAELAVLRDHVEQPDG